MVKENIDRGNSEIPTCCVAVAGRNGETEKPSFGAATAGRNRGTEEPLCRCSCRRNGGAPLSLQPPEKRKTPRLLSLKSELRAVGTPRLVSGRQVFPRRKAPAAVWTGEVHSESNCETRFARLPMVSHGRNKTHSVTTNWARYPLSKQQEEELEGDVEENGFDLLELKQLSE
nr:hypothetical protein Iba_chr06bCG11550 [Ipomoea batatas]